MSIEYNLAVEALIGSYYIIPYKCFVDSKHLIVHQAIESSSRFLNLACSYFCMYHKSDHISGCGKGRVPIK